MANPIGTLEIKLIAGIARLQSDMDKANQTVDRAMKGIDRSVGIAKRAFGGLLSVAGGAQILRMVDDYKKFDAQLRLSTRTTQEYAAAYKAVVGIARQSQSDIAAVGVLYARLTNNLRDFGTTQKEISGITEAVSLSLRVSNATVQETNSVMLQLSQSFGSGRINGQEFLAVSEGAPIIMRQLAKSLNTTVGALKDMSAQGKLTSDVLAKALADPEYVARLREQVKEVGTISSAWTVFLNNLKIFVGEADKASGAAKILQSAIIGLGDSLQFLVTAGLVAAGIAFTRWTGSLYAAAQAQAAEFAAGQRAAQQKVVLARAAVTLAEANFRSASATAASTLALNNNAAATTNAARAAAALTAAQTRLAVATNAASTSLGVMRGAIGLLGGPIGVAIVALTGLYFWINKIADDRKLKQFGSAIDGIRERAKALQQQVAAGVSTDNAFAAEIAGIKELEKARDGLFAKLKNQQRLIAEGSIFAPSQDEFKRTALEYVQAQKDIKNAQVDLGLAVEQYNEKLKPTVATTVEAVEATGKLTEAQKRLKAVMENRAKADEEIANLKLVNVLLQQGYDLEEARFRIESMRAGLTPSQIEALLQQRGIQADILEVESARQDRLRVWIKRQQDAYDKELKRIEDVKEANQKASDEYLKSVVEAEQKRRREQERTASELSRSITDALLRGFESGKTIAENFRETLKNMFNTLILRPVIEAIVKPVAGALGGIFSTEAFAGTGGGGIGDMLGTLKQGFDSLNGNVVGSIQDLGVFLSNGNGGLADKIGGFLGQHASSVASALSFAPAAMSLLQGDIKGAAFQGAGAAIGTAFGGPVGGAIGSFLGGALGGLFGGSGERYKQTGESRQLNVSGLSRKNVQREFSGDKMQGMAKTLDSLNAAFADNLSSIMREFGDDSNFRVRSTTRLRRTSGRLATEFYNPFGKGKQTAEYGGDAEMSKAFKQFANAVMGPYLVDAIKKSKIPEGIKKFFNGLSKPEDVQAAINAVVGLNKALRDLPPVFDAIDFALFTTEFMMTVAQLQEDFGAVQKYTELFYTQQENFDTFTRQLQAQFADLNLVMPTTKEGFRALVDGINVIDESSYNLFQALIRLAPAADAYYKSIEAQRAALYNLSADMFRTQFAFTRAQVYDKSGIPLSMLPSYDVGTSYVPQTGPAMIHQGERILTSSENRDFGNIAMEIRGMRGDFVNMRSELQSIAVTSARMQKSVDRLEKDGIIVRDVDANGDPQILQVEVVS